ncbi:MAG TPA: PKD domain-containing protein, partial [Bacteroidia bacterium]|nr:PKD domain-containing protein [Bacteroidia bacterium]
DTVAEKLTGVKHGNGTDYWLIVHKYYSDAFYAYQLSASGIVDTVISHIGSRHPVAYGPQLSGYALGCMKASPDGKKLAIVSGNGYGIAEYFDFDKNTGIVSNKVNIQADSIYSYYGLSFSPDNSKLYIACWLNNNGVYQFDLNAGNGNADSVVASKTKIVGQSPSHWAMQLATDGKIYIAGGAQYLSVINNPNNAGLACNYADMAVSLLNNTGALDMGLPNFIDSYDYTNTSFPYSISTVHDTAVCNGAPVMLNAQTSSSYTWSTGSNNQTISVNTLGTYWVETPGVNSCILVDTTYLNIGNPPPAIHVLKDTSVCSNVNYVLDASSANASSYSWSTGALSSSITPTVSNVYWVDMQTSLSPCLIRDSATINILTPPTIIASNYTVCTGNTVVITPTVTGGSGVYTYNWGAPFSGATYTTTILADSLYTISVKDLNGCITPNDTGKISVINAGTINLPAPVIGCKPVCLNLDSIPYNSLTNWQWFFGNGDTTSQAAASYCYNDSGSYKVSFTYTTTLGCKNKVSADSLVTVYPYPTAAFSASTFTTDVLNSGISFYNESINYLQPPQWTFGDSVTSTIVNPTHSFTNAGNYNVLLIVQNQKGCKDTAIHEVVITEIFTFYAPNSFTPNNDGKNETFLPVGSGWDNSTFKLLVYDRWGNLILNTSDPKQGWDGKVKGYLAQEDVYVWNVQVNNIINNIPHNYTGTVTLVK